MRKVGVLGAGLMGSGIAEVCAKAGYDTVVREVSEDLVKKGLARIEGSLGKAVEKGKLAAADRDAARKRISSTTRLEDLADCDLVIEAIVENLDVKKETYARARPDLQARDDLLLEHVVAHDHRDVRGDAARRPFRRPPLLQPRAGDEARRGRAHDLDVRGDGGRRLRVRALARQGADPHARQLGLHRQPPARAVPARRHPRPRGGRRHARGHRQGDGARLRVPDGAVQAARLRRARHDVCDREDHVRRVPREALRAAAAAEAHGPGGPVRQEVGRGFYEYGG